MTEDPDGTEEPAPGSRAAERAAASDPAPGVPTWPPGGHVEWRPWGQATFDEAANAGVPVLLSLTATWSEECRQMDAETYGEPRVAADIDDGFVPVRADVDRNPRVANRYAMGGVPSTAFLTPEGEVLNAAGPLTASGMRGAIEGVRRTWSEQGSTAGRVPRALADEEPPGAPLDASIEGHLLETLRENFDEQAGGWGTGAKFPMPRAIEFALKRDREMALRTLDAISSNLEDEHAGGFHRSAANRNWSSVSYEKLLDSNAALIRAFAAAYRYTGEESYRRSAERGVEFLTTTLWTDDAPGDRGAFAASQAAGPGADYYALEPSERERAEAPFVDETVLADWNALGIDALLSVAAVTDDETAEAFARRALATLVGSLIEEGETVHYRSPAAEDSDGERGLLLDTARTIRTLVTARGVLGPDPAVDAFDGEETASGPVALARELVDTAIDERRPGQTFVDGPIGDVGLLDRPLRPLDANVELAGALLDLAEVTGVDRYESIARETAEAFAGAHERFGPQAAAFGTVAGRLLRGTVRIDLTAAVGSDLHRAALRLADHEAIVVPAIGDAGEPIDRDVDYEPDAAYVVADGERSAPAFHPEELSERVASQL
ncbi:thioredoxin domain protein [Salinarchaeum sp. Harcht-Bsk1]|uniref:DUF255 domain-containing protein n=1 Tax=Salinarchaeum sp. Harcht-Bsk1 TaxID=1333523 RepID=UPI0003424896|nr:DUF255 domain-containing protein [Salinarchaeum sp. Harcht-Bsk1]AGN00126.1 thioredoxin domain protein [Salinarchaeum sp. Harcht-Bsk1]